MRDCLRGSLGLLTLLFFTVFFRSAEATPVNFYGAIGSGVYFEKGNDSVTEVTRLPLSGALGLAWTAWRVRAEYSSFRTVDGNATISVAREVESLMGWVSYDDFQEWKWIPTVGVGLGVIRTTVETRLNQNTELNRGAWRGGFALALGARSQWTKRLSVTPELRFNSAEDLKTKDARWGAFINLEITVL